MRKLAVFAIVGISLLLAGVVALSDGVPPASNTAGSFAQNGIGARARALGGSFVSIADDSSAGYWNPAGLAFMSGYTVGGMYVIAGGALGYTGAKDQGLSFLAVPTQSGSTSVWGGGLTWINKSFPMTEGTFSSDSSLFLLSLARGFPIGDWELALGTNIRYYYEKVAFGVGRGLGFDLAALVKGELGGIPVSFGLVSVDTLETTERWYNTPHNVPAYAPWILRTGVSALFLDGKIRLASDIEFSPLAIHSELVRNPDFDRLHFGVEVVPVKGFALRAGGIIWRTGRRWSLGIGLIPWEGLTIDYVYEMEIGGTSTAGVQRVGAHILSIDFQFLSLLSSLSE